MQTLAAPVYEVNQDSEWYKKMQKRNKDINKFFKDINEEFGFEDNGFSFYHSEYFGVSAHSKDYEKFKDELLKNPESNGMHPFRKRSKYYQIFKKKIEQIEDISPFKSHDVFGTNNISASQWVKDRWFFGVKNEEYVKGDEVSPIVFKEYLKVLMEVLD